VETLETRLTPNVTLSPGGHLVVTGDDKGVHDDIITLGAVLTAPEPSVRLTVNGSAFDFGSGQVSSIEVDPGAGSNQVEVGFTPAFVPLTVNFLGFDDVVTLDLSWD